MRFTKASVAALQLPDGKRDHVEWDDELPGFGVRIRAGGSRTWRIQYRFGSRQRSESLGDIRKVGLEDARKIARQRFAQVELGVDPSAQRSASAVAAALTLARAVERYLADKRDTLRPSTYKASERYFAVHWAPLRSHPIGAITRSVVAARLQEIIRAHGRTSAARARGVLSALFGWAMREGL
ncbi:MAG: integrase arm-type DNA-binding domain-containing protein, partial [Xanthobacteraceae bacterium]